MLLSSHGTDEISVELPPRNFNVVLRRFLSGVLRRVHRGAHRFRSSATTVALDMLRFPPFHPPYADALWRRRLREIFAATHRSFVKGGRYGRPPAPVAPSSVVFPPRRRRRFRRRRRAQRNAEDVCLSFDAAAAPPPFPTREK